MPLMVFRKRGGEGEGGLCTVFKLSKREGLVFGAR